MHLHNVERLRNYLRSHGRQAALLSNPATITWLTGYAAPIQTGPSPFEGGPALGWFRDGDLTLILSDGEAGAAMATGPQAGLQVRDYEGYTLNEPLAGMDRQAAVLKDFLKSQAGFIGSIAAELNPLPVPVYAVVQDTLKSATLQQADGQLSALRAIKTPQELTSIRAALKLCDLAQASVKQAVRPGVTELELWSHVQSAVETAAGAPLPMLADLVSGVRTAGIGGAPGGSAVLAGDPVIFDFVPRLDGYWGDNAATYFAGEPSAEMARAYATVRDALRRGVDLVRPGLRAKDLDQTLRETIRKAGYPPHPHHSGHGIGTTYHEEPRIVPYNEDRLEVGMVIALEPGIYLPGIGGVRLEHALLVNVDGCEVLTQHLE